MDLCAPVLVFGIVLVVVTTFLRLPRKERYIEIFRLVIARACHPLTAWPLPPAFPSEVGAMGQRTASSKSALSRTELIGSRSSRSASGKQVLHFVYL